MFSLLKSAFQVKDVRNRIFYTFMILVIFRIGAHITVPGVNAAALSTLSESGNSLFSILNTFGGGALRQYSIFALGVSPYITASIIVQLLQMDIIPRFTEWAKQGEVGRRKLNKATVYFTIVLGFIQAIGVSFGFNALTGYGLVRDTSMGGYMLIALILTTGTMLVMWLGEQITQKGVGNGVSMIIFAGIVAQLPAQLYTLFMKYLASDAQPLWINISIVVGIIVLILAMIMFVIFMEQAKRKISVQYSKRANGASQMAYLPLKINSAGVIPVIFASSFLLIPATILNLFAATYKGEAWFVLLNNAFNYRTVLGATVYITLIVLFTFFYAFVQVNPEKVAENLQKQGGYIISVRPGKGTENYISKLLMRLSTVGAVYLALIAAIPNFASVFIPGWPPNLALLGTNLLIIIGVILETTKQIQGKLIKRKYHGFIQ
ncbi:preprotein translocase subunit SecY [Granulicatella sp. zg-ZJ]|uniref:preprotein translocase subunit SecY n=1 Tax=unclassified Granulicatella TaxID=2630493 RepID=UPI0013BF43C7|nr:MULTISPECIES: preprotein translocase subunit SecY [unclassified Granulicatella]MBS4749769.1 preprotein translocase subunit SecY [Carnobacteriaceae bacterium zg-ZUI78]NEW61959.1 preprotein translocase subunit SecY [Granulicatella sp. zg-ZJ]NEW65648.1 preprotein translocase subunit SecY [Granulicatella sp. zg-84]QMI85711.1 preprotein translocase subunit SecY [Carnobacteriaceae bacterium zg-84]